MRKQVKESRNWQGELFFFDRSLRKPFHHHHEGSALNKLQLFNYMILLSALKAFKMSPSVHLSVIDDVLNQ